MILATSVTNKNGFVPKQKCQCVVRQNGSSLAKPMTKLIFPLGLFTLDGVKGYKETNLYPILVLGTQTLASKNITFSLMT